MDRTNADFRRRDAFAQAALTGLLANPNVIGRSDISGFALVNITETQLVNYALDFAIRMVQEIDRRDCNATGPLAVPASVPPESTTPVQVLDQIIGLIYQAKLDSLPLLRTIDDLVTDAINEIKNHVDRPPQMELVESLQGYLEEIQRLITRLYAAAAGSS